MTNLALALTIDPEFARLAKELVFMGASLNPQTEDPEFLNTPRHEFNLWFDPEAAHIVLRAPWKKIVCTPVDISVKTRMTNELIDRVKAGKSPAAQYIGKYAQLRGGTTIYGMNWPRPRGSTQASSQRKKPATWMSSGPRRGIWRYADVVGSRQAEA